MKMIVLILWLSLGFYQTTIAQYDNPPEPILEEEVVEEDILVTYTSPLLPYLSSCEDTLSKYQPKKEASDKKLIHYIYTSLSYPDSAKVDGIEGMVVLTFLIKKDGWIDSNSIKIRRNIGHGCGEEALKIVHSFNEKLGQWSFHRKPLAVRYNLPIRFKLN